MTSVYGALAVLCVAIGVLHLLRAAVLRRDVVAELSCAAMGLGMAGMFSPVGDPVPVPVWTVVFLIFLAWFGAIVLRRRATDLDGAAVAQLVGSGAMIFMLGQDHAAGAAGVDGGQGGHAAHGGGGDGLALVPMLIAIVLAAYFLWHALRCGDRLRRLRADAAPDASGAVTVRGPVLSLRSAQLVGVADLVMAVLMAVMLLGMV